MKNIGSFRPSIWRSTRRIAVSILILTIAFVMAGQSTVYAYTPQERRDMLKRGIVYVDEQCAAPGAPTTEDVEGAATRDAHAKTIIGIAKTLNLGRKGALIGLMTALTETGLKNYANDGTDGYGHTILGAYSQSLPHDAVGNDHDSVGIMQQRAVDGHWGPVDPKTNLADNIKWLMNPAYAAEAFFTMPEGKKESKAMVRVPNWENMDPGVVAQTVQQSEFPDRYNDNRALAEQYLARLYDGSPAVDLPIPLAGGAGGGGPAEAAVGSGAFCLQAPATGGAQGILSYIRLYAWNTYCSKEGLNKEGRDCGRDPMEAKDEYADAIRAALNRMDDGKADYVGDLCGERRDGNRIGADCGAFVTRVMRDSGADPTYNAKNGSTTYQLEYLRENAGAGKKYTRVTSQSQLKGGDIAIQDGHTFFYIGDELKGTGPNGEPGFDSNAASASQASYSCLLYG